MRREAKKAKRTKKELYESNWKRINRYPPRTTLI